MLWISFFTFCLAVVATASTLHVHVQSLNSSNSSQARTGPSSYYRGKNAAAKSQSGRVPPSAKSHNRSNKSAKKAPQPDYSVIMQKLWDLDVNGMNASTMQLALQGNTSTTSKVDMAPARLFTFVNESFLLSRPTVAAFRALADNYHDQVGVAETETNQESTEIESFLNSVCETKIMNATLMYLQQNGKPFPTMASLKTYLKIAWFTPYPRSKNWTKVVDSSAFEHVFLGESKPKQKSIGGLHNWIHAFYLEKNNILDYTGYINSYITIAPGRYVFGAKLRAYRNYWKSPFSSFVFGSSPEFDLASYTICFLQRVNKQCSFSINKKLMSIKVLRYMSMEYIDTAYPDIPF